MSQSTLTRPAGSAGRPGDGAGGPPASGAGAGGTNGTPPAPADEAPATLAALLAALAADPALTAAVAGWRDGDLRHDLVAPTAVRAVLTTLLAGARAPGARDGDSSVPVAGPVVVVTATTREAEDLASALRSLMPADDVALYPSWETLPHERLSPGSDTVGRRLAVLRRLAHPDGTGPRGMPSVVVAPIRSVLQPQVVGLADLVPVHVAVGDEVGLDALVEGLAAAAYGRVDLVEKRGQFAVRGGIVDVFPPTEEHPVRVEFFGDAVDTIRRFAVADQRTLESVDSLWAPPCRELLLTDTVRGRARALLANHPELSDLLGRIADGIAVDGMESLSPVLADALELFVDVLPDGAGVLVLDPERVRTRAHDLVATSREFLDASWANAAAGGQAPIDLGAAAYQDFGEVREHALAGGLPWWTLGPLGSLSGSGGGTADHAADPVAVASESAETSGRIDLFDVDPYRGDAERAAKDLSVALHAGWAAVVVTAGPGSAKRLAKVLTENGAPARVVPALPDPLPTDIVLVTTGALVGGFRAPALKVVVLGEDDLTGRVGSSTRDMRKMPSRRRNTVDPLALKPGDFVVHEQHGVGRFVEMVERTLNNATREYLVVEYAPSKRNQPGDRLFVPTDSLDQLSRYVGGDAPALDKMGGGDWAKRKGRARKAVKEIAGELIRLYAARNSTVGHAFGPDTPWQGELEDAFPYAETPDQLACIDEVKADMERPTPMDRLVCGDVGYGKTEIAVRAAFKAIQDGKQVALLVPTTLLVQQHGQTFTERYASFPVKVAQLSRFQSRTESAAVLAGLADGSIDLVIGTHRLLSGEVRMKDLGLVIVDEEQRFGVEHKEALKRLRTSVDVLSMSATPIPRTLEMAVTGIREMSTIATPPEERHPVLTYVGGYDEKQVGAAIRREMLRDGQVFFVHNKVNDIERAAARIAELVPDARIAVAHGQMGEHQLEKVIVDFWERRFDVLVCTTIVESGLDIPNANTLILDRAETMGLSQLHQLRGRVGRGRERAYAYFFYDVDRPMTETAHDRLATIAQHTDLGAGTAVAMKDLEIRGAGNLLGGEQAGHIADVGFDLYIRLVGEAVTAFRRGGEDAEAPDVRVELPVDAHLPHDYLASERLRLEVYRRLADAADDAAATAVGEELRDRFGAWPEPVANLFAVARFRSHARRAGLTEVTLAGRHVRFGPVELADSARMRLDRLYPASLVKQVTRTILVPRPTTARVGGEPLRDVALLEWCAGVLESVLEVPAQPPADTSAGQPPRGGPPGVAGPGTRVLQEVGAR